MSETVTDDEGRFIIYGSQTEITDIEAKLKIYHDCDNKNEVRLMVSLKYSSCAF